MAILSKEKATEAITTLTYAANTVVVDELTALKNTLEKEGQSADVIELIENCKTTQETFNNELNDVINGIIEEYRKLEILATQRAKGGSIAAIQKRSVTAKTGNVGTRSSDVRRRGL